jgi:TolB-like protein
MKVRSLLTRMGAYMSGRAVVLGLLLLSAALAVVALVGRPRISLRVQTPSKQPMLAVLPFKNLSGEPELEIVASDLTAAVVEAVSETGRVSALAREKTFGLQLDRRGIEEAARSLGADYVIAGSLDEEDGRIQVDAYLFRSGPAPALWVERLEWEASERSSVPSEVADRVREAIQRPY